VAATISTIAVAGVALAQQKPGQPDLDALLARVADRVEHYFARAQSIVCQETVRLQPLRHDFGAADGHVRQLVYELRVAWDAAEDGGAPEPKVQRELLTVDGRPPRENDRDACMDPKSISPEPLAMLLPNNQPEYVFSVHGDGKIDGHPSIVLDYKSRVVGRANVAWKGDCVSIDLPGRTRGRLWIDQASGDVLRYDEGLTGMFEFDVPRSKQIFNGPQSIDLPRGCVGSGCQLIHNAGDALTAVPLGAAFLLRSERAERAAGLFVVAAIFVSACVAGVEAITRLIHPDAPSHLWALALAGAIGYAGNRVAARIRLRAGRRLDSAALIADGHHARADAYVSLAVIASAAVVAVGLPIADPLIGLAITVVILRITWQSWRTVRGHDHAH